MASVLAVSDLVFKNLLAELDLNPVWEKWRGYFFAASVVCTLIPFYLTINGLSVNCVPEHTGLNDSSSVTLSVSQTLYINAVCSSNDDLLLMRYCGAAMLLMVIVILFVSSYWLHFRHVADGFRTFNEARKKVHDLVLSRDEMKSLCSNVLHPVLEKNEAYGMIKETALLLSFHRKNDDVFNSYVRRCRCLFVTISFCIIISIIFSIFFWLNRNMSFTCRINGSNTIPDLGKGGVSSYICATNEATALCLFVTAYALTLILQCITILVGFSIRKIFMRKCSTIHEQTPQGNERKQTDSRPKHFTEWYKTLSLMILFEDSAHPFKSGALKDVVQHLYAAKLAFIDEINLLQTIDIGDFSHVKIYSQIFGQLPEMITCIREHFISLPSKDVDDRTLENYIQAMKAARYSIEHVATRKFIELLSNGKYWELLINLLENSDLKENTTNASEVVKLLPDPTSEHPSSVGESRHSILFYAFQSKHSSSGPVKFAAAKLLRKDKQLSDLSVTTETSAKGAKPITTSKVTLREHIRSTYKSKAHEIIHEMGWGCDEDDDETESSTDDSTPGHRSDPSVGENDPFLYAGNATTPKTTRSPDGEAEKASNKDSP